MLLKQSGKMVFGKSRVISHFLQSQRLREVIVDVGQQTVELLIVIVALFRSIFRSCKKGVIVFPADGGQDIDQISVYGVFPEGDAGGKIERADLHKPGVNMLIDTGSRPFRQKTGIEQHGLQGTVIVEAGQRIHIKHKDETLAPVRLHNLVKGEPGDKEDVARLQLIGMVVGENGVAVLDRNEDLYGVVLVQGIAFVLDIMPDTDIGI